MPRVHTRVHQTRTGTHCADVREGFAQEETAARCTPGTGEHINLRQVEQIVVLARGSGHIARRFTFIESQEIDVAVLFHWSTDIVQRKLHSIM